MKAVEAVKVKFYCRYIQYSWGTWLPHLRSTWHQWRLSSFSQCSCSAAFVSSLRPPGNPHVIFNGLQPKWELPKKTCLVYQQRNHELWRIFLLSSFLETRRKSIYPILSLLQCFFSFATNHCFPISHFYKYWKPNWHSWQLGNLTIHCTVRRWGRRGVKKQLGRTGNCQQNWDQWTFCMRLWNCPSYNL